MWFGYEMVTQRSVFPCTRCSVPTPLVVDVGYADPPLREHNRRGRKEGLVVLRSAVERLNAQEYEIRKKRQTNRVERAGSVSALRRY